MNFDLQGHRGARGLRPENTLPAFLYALDVGVNTLELDVVVSADRQIVVSHDPWFSSRISSHPDGRPVTEKEEHSLRLYEMSYEEIAKYDCGARGNAEFPQQIPLPARKPLLSEVLALTADDGQPTDPVFYNIETKSTPEGDGTLHPDPKEFVSLLHAVLVGLKTLGRATLQSFDMRTLREAKTLDPDWKLALLVEPTVSKTADELIAALGFKPEILSPHYSLVDETLVQWAHDKNIEILPWTVNDKTTMHELIEMGITGLITDYPNWGREVLLSRGLVNV